MFVTMPPGVLSHEGGIPVYTVQPGSTSAYVAIANAGSAPITRYYILGYGSQTYQYQAMISLGGVTTQVNGKVVGPGGTGLCSVKIRR